MATVKNRGRFFGPRPSRSDELVPGLNRDHFKGSRAGGRCVQRRTSTVGGPVHRVSLLLLAAALGSAGLASSQEVTKPRSTTERLPRPAGVTAMQQRDGTILLAWQPVAGALSYKVTRSVPPAGATRLTLPAPSDTQYVDRDVKAGSTYYYVVSAVNDAGIEGLRAGTAPVTATLSSTSTTAMALMDPDPGSDTGSEGTAQTPVAPPTDVVAKPYPYRTPTVRWQSSVQGARFIVERLDPTVYASEALKAVWALVPGSQPDKAWLCCQMVDGSPPPFGYLKYRVTTIDAAGRRSTPTETTIGNDPIRTVAPALFAEGMKVGETKQLAGGDRGYTWVSLDTMIVSFWSPGVVQGKARGTTYVVWTKRNDRGELQSLIWRVFVE
jgi:hypothetical protein